MEQTPRQQLTGRPLVDGEVDRVGLDVPLAKVTVLGPGKTDVALLEISQRVSPLTLNVEVR